jgi:rubredoxin
MGVLDDIFGSSSNPAGTGWEPHQTTRDCPSCAAGFTLHERRVERHTECRQLDPGGRQS